MQYHYSILKPGGNDTALVVGIVKDSIIRKKINDQIMAEHPNVEQVGFVNLDPQSAELMMAGLEYCGNASRSTAWQILKGESGEVKITVSGAKSQLRAGVDKNGNAWAQMPIYSDPANITFLQDGSAVVAMEGITHVVVEDKYADANITQLKEIALQKLTRLGLNQAVAAAGVMFTSPTDKGIKIKPVVWVRDIQTLFYETACGSGTTAVGLLEALKADSSITVPVIQPTNIPIEIKVNYNGNEFKDAFISGPLEVLGQDLVLDQK